MNVAGPIRSRPLSFSSSGQDAGGGSSSSTNDVDMYLDVPSFELSLDEFEEYALARLKVSYYFILWHCMGKLRTRGRKIDKVTKQVVSLSVHLTIKKMLKAALLINVSPQ